MPKRPDKTQYQSFDQICDRLDGIIEAVRDKDTSLERSLDLFDEAIVLGSAAVEMVDITELTPEEEARLEESVHAESDAQEQAAQEDSASDASDGDTE